MLSINSVQEQLNKVNVRMRSQLNSSPSELMTSLEQIISTGGKRIRPRISLLVGEMLGADPDRLINLAAAVEMLHTATLVHDDLVDGAMLRRGAATLNATWPPAATVLAGDLVFASAAKLAADTHSVDLMRMFAETLTIIINGEVGYLFRNGSGADRDVYYNWIYAKTASLFELSSGAAAMLGSGDDAEISAAMEYGRAVGMAFQIVDDVLDFTGEQAEIGKPVASDLRQGIITLPTIYYAETHPDDSSIQMLINHKFQDEHLINRLSDAICRSDAIQQSIDEASDFVQTGLDALSILPETPEKFALVELGRYVVSRNI